MFCEKEPDEEWINKNILLQNKDCTPSSRGGGKVVCEFCGRVHTTRDDQCDISTDEHKDGNVLEAANAIKLQDLYDQIKYKRDLVFQVMFNTDLDRSVNLAAVRVNEITDRATKSSNKVNLSSCFEAFE